MSKLVLRSYSEVILSSRYLIYVLFLNATTVLTYVAEF